LDLDMWDELEKGEEEVEEEEGDAGEAGEAGEDGAEWWSERSASRCIAEKGDAEKGEAGPVRGGRT